MRAMTEIFLADTYALIEIIKGSPRYRRFLSFHLVITEHNLIELYYHCLHDHGKETAVMYQQLYRGNVVPISDSTIQLAMEIKLRFKHEKLSYADCMGYARAIELGVKFLTGDQKFSDKENVEFVK